MELLAPAGSRAALTVALTAGADAVYVGAPGCNARSLSREFSFQELDSMIHQAHEAGRRIYMAMNSLVKEEELPRTLTLLARLEQMRPDGLIVQDPGLLRICRQHFPSLVLHASTLMSVHNSQAADWLTGMGCSRVVLARELTLDEIRAIGRTSRAELEVFVQGAMCFSYSGLCLFSSLHGGRSSLRGRCVQPCRRRYSWAGERGRGAAGYVFSMNDLCGIDLLPALQRAGVASLKIEGRLKSVEYVRYTVQAYRLVLDGLDQSRGEQQKRLAEARKLLSASLGRKPSSGFFLSASGRGVITPGVSGNTGQVLGPVRRVIRKTGRGRQKVILEMVLRAGLQKGDRLRLHFEESGDRLSFTLQGLIRSGREVSRARAGERVQCVAPGSLAIPERGRIQVYKVDVRQRRQQERQEQLPAQVAVPLPDTARQRQTEVLALLGFQGKAGTRARPRGGKRQKARQGREPSWWVCVRSPHAMEQRLPLRPARFLLPLTRKNVALVSRIRRHRERTVWVLPPVIDEDRFAWFGETIQRLARSGFRQFQLGHMGQTGFFSGLQTSCQPALYGAYTLNILNSSALLTCAAQGLSAVQFSLETDRENLAQALAHFHRAMARQKGSLQVGMYVFGRPPLFTARFRDGHLRYHRPLRSPRGEEILLDRDEGLTHARAGKVFSLLDHAETLKSMGIDYFVVDLRGAGFKKEVALLQSCLRRSRGQRPDVLAGNFAGRLQ